MKWGRRKGKSVASSPGGKHHDYLEAHTMVLQIYEYKEAQTN